MYKYIKSNKDIEVGDKVRYLGEDFEHDFSTNICKEDIVNEIDEIILTVSEVIFNNKNIVEGVYYEEIQTNKNNFWCEAMFESFEKGLFEVVEYKNIYTVEDFKNDIIELRKNYENYDDIMCLIIDNIFLNLLNKIGTEI